MIAKTYDLIVAGEINPDLILTDPHIQPEFGQKEILVQDAALVPGSSTVICACGTARLGLKTAFMGVVGEDIFGHFMLEALTKRGVDISHIIRDPEQQTGLSVILNRVSDRAILTHVGTIDTLTEAHIPDSLLNQARHLHVASYFLQTQLQPGLPTLFRRAKALGLTTSLDTNWDPNERWGGVIELMSFTDVLLLNKNEAMAITNQTDEEAALEQLARLCPTVAVKLGARGAIARQYDKVVQTNALKIDVVDTVGAGDTFDSGFLFGYLSGWTLDQSLELASVCGSLSTREAGGTNGQPTLEEALEYVER